MSEQLALNIRLREDATFANYAGDAAGQLQAATGVVWVVGPSGSGKTHLLQALCHEDQNALYLSDWAEFEPAVLSQLDDVACLALDDIQSLPGDRDWELALFDVINSTLATSRRLVMASHLYPSQIECELPDLSSRLRAALIVEAAIPQDEDRLRVLVSRASQRGFTLNDETARYLLQRVSRNMSDLIAMLDTLDRETLRHQRRLTIPFVKSVLGL